MSTEGTIKIVGAHEKDQNEPESYLLWVNERYFRVISPDDNWRSSSNLQPTKPILHTGPFLPTDSGLFKKFQWMEP